MSKTRMGKRVASLLLSLVMMLSLLPTTVYATEDTGGGTGATYDAVQQTESGDNTENTGKLESTGEGEDDSEAGNEGETSVTYVAQVGDVQYKTLKEAIGVAADGATVSLLDNVTLNTTLTVAKSITIDVGGFTLTVATDGDGIVVNNATLTLTGTGKYVFNCTASGSDGIFVNNTVEGGTSELNLNGNVDINVSGNVSSAIHAYASAGKAVVNINAGTITARGSKQFPGVVVDQNATLNMTGGTFDLSMDFDAYSDGNDVVGVLIWGGSSHKQENCAVNISGGTFKVGGKNAFAQAVQVGMSNGYSENCTVNISGGNVVLNPTEGGKGYVYTAYKASYATAAITSGTVSGKVTAIANAYIRDLENDGLTISGGTFSGITVDEKYLADGKTLDASGNVVDKAPEVKPVTVNGVGYDTLAAAIAAAESGATVKLLADVNENVEIAAGKNLTLDLNGFTLNGGTGTNKAALTNYGTITITDSSEAKTGTIKRDDIGTVGETSYYVILNQGTMTIESGNVINNSGYKKANSTGSMVGSSLICNGDCNGGSTLTINGGTFTQYNFIAIKNGALGVLNVTGGMITSNHSAIQNWFEADITGGEINGQLWTDAYTAGGSNGKTKIGGNATFTGEIVMDIYGNSVAPKLEITGGKLNVTNWRITGAAAAVGAKPAVSGGTFTAKVPAEYLADGFEIKESTDASGNTTYGVEKAASYVAKIDEQSYATLQAAFDAAKTGDTVTLLADTTEDVEINKNITLDLGGKTLTNTNAGKATVTIAKGATATVKNGSVMGGTSFYTIQNNGTATLEGVTATAGNTGSSMIDNFGDLTINSGTYTGGLDTVKNESGAKLTITGGDFTLERGTSKGFTGVVFNYGDLTITGGTFIQSDTSAPYGQAQVIHTDKDKSGSSVPSTVITGGTFKNLCTKSTAWTVRATNAAAGATKISGGAFNKKVSEGYWAEGYGVYQTASGEYTAMPADKVARLGLYNYYTTLEEAIAAVGTGVSTSAVVYLLENVTIDTQLVIDNSKAITLDLNGFTLTSTYAMGEATGEGRYALVNKTALTVKNGTFAAGQARAIGAYAKLTLTKATVTQTLTGGHACVAFCANDTAYTITNSEINGAYAVANFANNATITIKDSKLKGSGCGLYHNGSNYGLKLTVTDTTINGSLDGAIGNENDPSGVYISGSASHGTMQKATFTNCTIKGATAIEVKYTDLTLTDCTVEATAKNPSYSQNNNGMTALGFAVVSTDNAKDDKTPVPAGTVTITGTKGKYTGLVGLGALKSVKETYKDFTDNTIQVSGGTFTSAVMPEYCADGFVPTQNDDGTYGVREANYVAEVSGTKYESLAEAIEAAGRNATVKLLADTRENVTISTPYLTLDLNGFTLNGSTGERKPALTVTARVTVKDSSENQTGTIMREDTAENSGVSSHYVIDVQGDGWLTFEGGNVKNDSGAGGTKGASLVRVGSDSVAKYPGLNIKGGTFTQDKFIVIKVERGDLFLNGGSLNSANSYAVQTWHRATIKGGTVNGAVSSWTYDGGPGAETTISGGTVNGNVEAISYDGKAGKPALVSISGGTVNGTLIAGIYNSATEPTKDMATIEITGGTFSSDPTKYVIEDSAITANADGTFGVAKAYLAKVGKTSYYTMDEARKAQSTSGEDIVLLRDYTTGSPFRSGISARVVDLNGYTWTCTGKDANSAAFEISDSSASLTVKNGKVVSSQLVGLIPSAMGGTIKYDNSGLVFESVEMKTTAHSGIETNGNNTNDTVTLKGSTLNVPNGFGIYFPSSGMLTIENSTINAKTMGVQVCAGSLSINAGSTITVTGDAVSKTENDGAIQDGAAISIVNRTGYKGLGNVTVTGGKFTAKTGNAAIKAYDWESNNKVEETFTANETVAVSGGTFSSIPDNMTELCAKDYIPELTPSGAYEVRKADYVAAISDKQYTSLANAIAAAKDGDTVKLLGDVVLDKTLIIKDKTITLDLNGRTISNSADIWNENTYAWSLISVRDKGNLTIDDTTGGGTLKAKENDCFALDVYAYDTKNVENTKLTINAGNYVGNISAVYAFTGKATINGGHFSIQQKENGSDPYRLTLNCYDSSYKAGTAHITVTGGTFVGFDPANNPAEGAGTSFVAESVGVDKNTDGTFTAKPNMAAQIVDAGGGSVKAYGDLAEAIAAAEDGETVKLLDNIDLDAQIATGKAITIDGQGKYTIKATRKLVGENNKAGMFYRTTSAQGTLTFLNVTLDGNSVSKIFLNEGGAGETVFDGVTSINGGGMAYGSGIHISGGGSHATIRNSTLTGSTGTTELTDKNYYAANDLWVGGNVYVTVENSTIGTVFVNSAPSATATNGVVHGQLTITGENTKITYLSGEEEDATKVDKFGNNGSLVKIDSGSVDTIFDMGSYEISGGTFKTEIKPEWCAPGYIPKANGDGSYTVVKGTYVAEYNGTKYETLQEAIDAASHRNGGQTEVKLLCDLTITETVVFAKEFSAGSVLLNLGGYTLTGNGCRALQINKGNLYLENGTVTSTGDNIDSSKSVIRIGSDDTAYSGVSPLLYMRNGAKVLAPKTYGVTIFGSKTVSEQLTVAGNASIEATGPSPAISGQGGQAYHVDGKGTKVIITGNAVVSATNNYAIYHPDNGTLDIQGGTITGKGGIQMCSGTLTISGSPKIEALGKADHETGAAGPIYDVAAISVVNRSYPGGAPVVTIKGTPTITAVDGEVIHAYTWSNNTESVWAEAGDNINVSGGTYSKDFKEAYLAADCTLVPNDNGTYTVKQEPVAEYNGTPYTSLPQALLDARNAGGGEVKLLKDVTQTTYSLDIGKVTLNLNTKTLTLDGGAQLYTSGDATINNGTIKRIDTPTSGNANDFAIQVMSGSSLTLGATSADTVTIESTYGVYNAGGTLTVSHAVITTDGWSIAVNDSKTKTGEVTIGEGAVITSKTGNCIGTRVNSKPNVTITGGQLTSDGTNWGAGVIYWASEGTLTITGGTFTASSAAGSTAAAVYQKNGTVKISGSSTKLLGSNALVAQVGEGSTGTMVTELSGGTYSTKPEETWVVNGYRAIENTDGSYTVKEGEYTVQVTSRTVSSDTPVANVSGGGETTYEVGTTVTAASLSGYTFKGWYLEKYTDDNSTLVKTDLSFTYKPTADCTLIAVYEPISGAKFYLTVHASEFTVTDSVVYDSYMHDQVAAGESVTVRFEGKENFLYWVNASRKVVSISKEYTFIMGSETTLTAVYGKTREAQATVVFMSDSDQIITSKAYKSGTAIQFPTPPIKMGCTFTGWSMTEQEIQAAIAASNNGVIVVKARYTDPSTPYTVTVLYPDDTKEEYSGMVGKTVTLTAKEISGKIFSYWTDSENNVLGYAKTLMLAPSGSITVKAVYSDTAVEAKPVITMTAVEAGEVGTGYYVISFTATRAVPEGYTVVKQGILYSVDSQCSGEGAKDYMKLTDEGSVPAGIYVYEGNNTALSGVTRFNAKTGAVDRTIYGRGYMVLKNSSGVMEYVYSDNILSGNYSNLANIGG